MSDIFDAFRGASQSLHPELLQLRRHLHANPELSWDESNTASHIQSLLEKNGLHITRKLARTGFYTDIEGAHPGPTIAYRADLDALAIQDMKDVTYKSAAHGVAHMCGHDAHSTIAYGVARLLHTHRHLLHGTIRVFWQPAEESTPSGAPIMIEEGLLDGVDAVYGIHVDPDLPSGHVGLKYGADTASYDTLTVSVVAPNTTHSARPHTGVDTVWVATQFIQQLYQLPGRITDARSPAVITICAVNGGDALNVIPSVMQFGGTIRTSDERIRNRLLNHIRKLAAQLGDLHGVEMRLSLIQGAPAVKNNPKLVDFVRAELIQSIGLSKLHDREQSMGSEDFGYYTEIRPSVFLRIGTRESERTGHPLHSNHFDIDEAVLGESAGLLAYLLTRHLMTLSSS